MKPIWTCCVSVLLLFCGLTGSVAMADSRGLEVDETNPWFSFYIIDKTAKERTDLTKAFGFNERAAVARIDKSLAFAYPKLIASRPKGIIESEPDKRLAMIYRKMAWLVANDQIIAGQILFYTAVRLKSEDARKGIAPDLPYLTLHHFLYNAVCAGDDEDAASNQGGDVCDAVADARMRAGKELTSDRLKQYLNWVALGLAFDDKIAYESGVFLMESENPNRGEREIVKSILKPLLKKNANPANR